MTPGERLRQAREKLGLSQSKLGEPFGFPYSKIRDLESGKQRLTAEIAEGFEDLFSIARSWLQTGEGEMFSTPSQADTGYISSVAAMMREMDEDTQKDIYLSVQKEKLLRELLKERLEKKTG